MTEFTPDSPLIINACLTGMVAMKEHSPHVPLTVAEIVADAVAAHREGASIVHIHARDNAGIPTWDPGIYRELIIGIREQAPGLLVCASTSGRLWSERAKRIAVLQLEPEARPDLASLTLGSVQFPKHFSANPPEEIAFLVDAMNANGVKPELEVFEDAMLEEAERLIAAGGLKPPHYFNLLLGNRSTAEATPWALARITARLPADSVWSAAGIGRHQFPMNCLAIAMGGGIRVGLEDSLFDYTGGEKTLVTNEQLVARVAGVARAMQRPISTPAETRALLLGPPVMSLLRWRSLLAQLLQENAGETFMRNRHLAHFLAPMMSLAGFCCAAEIDTLPWDLQSLSSAPEIFQDATRSASDVQAIFYEGLPYRGRPTRVFAYYGLPRSEAWQKVPAMVLVHGGGGSAFIPWVRLWVNRGYAAIAMDTCGCVNNGGYENHPRHESGGPPGWGGFDQIEEPIQDQWTYHAVADVILAHSLIRSFPEVDPERIGLTGISWGGYLASIVAGVDQRFRFVAPVYGCGFLGDDSTWLGTFQAMGPEKAAKWLSLWDPAVYLPRAQMPMLWVTGTTDFAYPMDSLQKSYRLPKAPRTLCLRVGMLHGHGGPGENPEEIHALANALLHDGTPLARITTAGREGRNAWITFESPTPILTAELNYTTDTGPWQERTWKTIPADLDTQAGRAAVVLPGDTTVYYFNIVDDRDLAVSSEHEEMMVSNPNEGDGK